MQVKYIPKPCSSSLDRASTRVSHSGLKEIEKDMIYIARHTNAERRQKWSRVEFVVKVLGDKEEFNCECGLFAHMGILCGHALKVMDYVGVTRIPSKHILKRWTREARDILPEYLRHYQKDEAHGKAVTYRHSSLYILAMELVRLGDASAEAYEKLVTLFKGNFAVMARYDDARDGLGLEDRMTGKKRKETDGSISEENTPLQLVSTNAMVGLTAPSRKVKSGRPSTSREKAPYEETGRRTRFLQHIQEGWS